MLVVAALALSAWFAPYPLDRGIAAGLLAAYAVLLVLRPSIWLVLLPALWPVVDLAPWGGHIHFTESDALALTTLAALGLREAFAPPGATLSGRAPLKLRAGALMLFGLLAASVVIAGVRGGLPLPAFDAAALVGYNTPVNALRVGKGFLFAFALIPFLHLAVRRDGERALDRFTLGLTAGFFSCALAASWERIAFPGLTNFASDYRTSALFWEMHVGGAALDAWLMLSFPFALLSFRRAHGWLGRLLALVVMGVGIYAMFTTFSRVVYGAMLVSLTVLGLAALGRPADPAAASGPRNRPVVLSGLLAVVLLGGMMTFPEGGYRALLAFTGVALLVWPAGAAIHGLSVGRFALGLTGGMVLALVSAAVMLAVPKGIYLAYAALWLAAVMLLGLRGRGVTAGAALLASLVGMALTTALVSAFWSEPTRFVGTLGAAILVIAVLARQSLGRVPLWRPQLRDVQGLVAVLVVGGMVVTTLGGYYMGSRLSNTGTDAGIRFQHTSRSLGLVHGPVDALIGLGLGRYPEAYFWNVTEHGTPGALALLNEADGRAMRIAGPREGHSIDEVVLLTQRLPTDVTVPLELRLRARTAEDTDLIAQVCRKHLLYANPCATTVLHLHGQARWQTVTARLDDPSMAVAGNLHRTTTLTLGTTAAKAIDLDDIQLTDALQRQLVRNGDFERGGDDWFFSSDREHLPWHAKNMFVHAFVEQGLLGLVAVMSIVVAALVHLARSPTRQQPHAATLLAALAGLTTVGMVDSLFDMPRITVFVLLVAWLGLNLRRPPVR